jgi:nicotinamide mononucleotide (NMN) deamidase PncC
MLAATARLIRQIHDSATRLVVAVSGGGASAVASLLEVPGASRSILEASVPYSEAAMIAWLGGRPDRFCAPETARAMAMVAFLRAHRFVGPEGPIAGVAATASLASDRPKRGPHRVHLAVQTAEATVHQSLELRKGHRTRAAEERLVSCLLLDAVAEACGLDQDQRLAPEFAQGEQLQRSRTEAPESWRDLLLGRVAQVRLGASAAAVPQARAIFPGAFNPLHVGHRRMAQIAEELLGVPVEYEVSILNVSKPPLDYFEMARRGAQFPPERAVWLTRGPTFLEKSTLFPRTTFVVGADTLRRIADPAYYGNDRGACRTAIETIVARGCRFLVFGRLTKDRFIRLADLDLPGSLRAICREVPPELFREDICSTALRNEEKGIGDLEH